MNKIKIHLKDFPDNIAIALDDRFRDKFFQIIFKIINQKKLSQVLGVKQNTVINWKKGDNLIPLSKIKSIINKLKIESIIFSGIEKHTTQYKVQKGEFNSINSPIFPITDSPELREIILHFMGDGCVVKYAAYYNVDIEAKNEFIRELKKVFGKVEYKIYKDHVHFSMAIPHILSNYFKVDFHGNKCRVPKQLFNGNRMELAAILRAIIIDEGTIDGSNVRIDSNNEPFLRDIKNIALKLGYDCGKIWKSQGPIFRFNILAESIGKLYQEICPLPIKKKGAQLKLACDSRDREWKYFIPGTNKVRIISELLKSPRSSVELSWKLRIHRNMINKHLKWLKNNGLIRVSGKSVYSFVYCIKDRDKAKKFIKNPEIFFKDDKIIKWGVTQLKILNLLKNKSKLKRIRIETKISKTSALKVLKSLIKKGFVSKKEKEYYLTDKGRKLLNYDEKLIKFALYSNITNLKEINKIDLNRVGNV